MSQYYPIMLNIREKNCLVIGGGEVAARKAASLLEAGAKVTVVSPELNPVLSRMVDKKQLSYCRGNYRPEDLDGMFLVIAATDNEEVNRQVATDCFARNILINVVDDPPKCNFIVPAVVRRGSLTIAVSTEGKSPKMARKIREELEETFGVEYGVFLDLLGEVRSQVIARFKDADDRLKVFDKLVQLDLLDLIREGKTELAKERIYQCILSLRD